MLYEFCLQSDSSRLGSESSVEFTSPLLELWIISDHAPQKFSYAQALVQPGFMMIAWKRKMDFLLSKLLLDALLSVPEVLKKIFKTCRLCAITYLNAAVRDFK